MNTHFSALPESVVARGVQGPDGVDTAQCTAMSVKVPVSWAEVSRHDKISSYFLDHQHEVHLLEGIADVWSLLSVLFEVHVPLLIFPHTYRHYCWMDLRMYKSCLRNWSLLRGGPCKRHGDRFLSLLTFKHFSFCFSRCTAWL